VKIREYLLVIPYCTSDLSQTGISAFCASIGYCDGDLTSQSFIAAVDELEFFSCRVEA